MKTKEHQLVMLPTDKASKIHLGKTLESTPENSDSKPDWQPQHLYFISDEPIKDNDIVLEYNSGAGNPYYRLFKKGHLETILIHHTNQPFTKYSIKKVIATTNPDLWKILSDDKLEGKGIIINKEFGIPKIPIEFVEVYVKEQGKIDKVLLEYGTITNTRNHTKKYQVEFIKLKPNNSVIVHKVKSEDSIQSILNYMAENRYNETNPVLYAYVASNLIHPVKEKMYSKEKLNSVFNNSNNENHLEFIYQRLQFVYSEDTNIDYMLKLRKIIEFTKNL